MFCLSDRLAFTRRGGSPEQSAAAQQPIRRKLSACANGHALALQVPPEDLWDHSSGTPLPPNLSVCRGPPITDMTGAVVVDEDVLPSSARDCCRKQPAGQFAYFTSRIREYCIVCTFSCSAPGYAMSRVLCRVRRSGSDLGRRTGPSATGRIDDHRHTETFSRGFELLKRLRPPTNQAEHVHASFPVRL